MNSMKNQKGQTRLIELVRALTRASGGIGLARQLFSMVRNSSRF